MGYVSYINDDTQWPHTLHVGRFHANRHEKALPMYVTVSVGVWGLQRQVLPESNPRLNNAVSQFPQTGSFKASLQEHLDRFVVISVIVIHRSRGGSNDYSNILHISHSRESDHEEFCRSSRQNPHWPRRRSPNRPGLSHWRPMEHGQ